MSASTSQDEIPPPPPPPPSSQTPTQQTPHTVSTIKLPILKKGEYDIWAMKMEHYLAHTDYPIWEVIQNGNGPVSITTDTSGQIKVLPPRTAEEIVARERERKARTTLLMALPEDHLAKFHKMTDAKEMWDAIKSRFGGNDESKKMQKYILKQQFEGFSVSNTEGLHKGYDRFQSLLSQLEIHGAGVSTEDANQKFLRSLPSAWSQVSLIMRTKPGVDTLSFDDLYNNLRVFESDIKGSTASSSSSPQNVAFVSENTNSTNEVSTAYCVPNLSGQNTKYEQTSSYSLLANQSSCPQLDHEDLEQIDEYDLEEMDLKWQVAMISMRMKKFYKKTGRKLQFDAKEAVGFDKTKVECYNCHKTGHFARECRFKGTQDNRRRDAWNSGNKDGSRTGQKEDSKALVTVDGEGVDWTTHSEDEDYALMACNSSDSDTEVISCSNKCKESYANLKKLYDAQREQLNDASIEIKAYSQGLKKVEAQLVAHQQGQLWYEQKIKFMKIDLDDKTDVLTYHKKLLAEAQKEKEDLKAKVEKWQNSSKNLSKLLNTQMSANDKFGLGYGDHRYDGILSYENEVLQSVFMNKESDLENQPLNDRFADGMHAVPPPMTGNYMPTGPEIEIDYSQFTYGPKQTQPSESESQSSECDTCESNISTEPSELVSEPVVNESNVECQPKVWSDAPIIEEYESDSEDECVSIPTKQQETPSFANQQVKTPRENVKSQFTHSQKPKVDKKDLGYGFTVRACFVCGSLNHLIRDCDFHEKRMARKANLNSGINKKTSQKELRETWNNVQKVNKQNQFVPSAVLTRTGKIPVNTARASGTKNISTATQSFNRQTVLTSTAMKVNTVKPTVNRVRPANVFHKTHSPYTRPFKKTTVLRTDFSKQKGNTAKVNAVSTVGGKGKLLLSPQQIVIRDHKDTTGTILNHLIRDCDFHEKRMARKAELNNGWNNVKRVNKQNQFVPSAVLTRTGKIPVSTARASSTTNFSTARKSSNRQTVLTSTAMKVNTVKPIVNRVRPANVFHKTHSPFSRPFKKTTILRTDFSKQKVNTAKVNTVSTVGGKRETVVKPSAGCNWRPQRYNWHNDYPHRALKNKGIVDSGCSRHMTGNKAYLAEFQDFNGGPVAFGGSKGYITGKGKIKTGKLDFEDVCFVKELQHFNLFSVSQMCDKKNKVLFTDSECLVLSPEFKLPDENQVLLKIPRQNNMYSFNLENIVPSGGLACLIAKATTDESNKWHRRLGHVNFKNLNKLVKGNLVRGLPSKIFQNDHTCVACQKGKQHKASCKAKSVSSISHSLQLLHMDLFGPTSVRSLNHKTYCLVITDDFSRFSWVFFLRTKDETSGILKDFIGQIENQLNKKVKTIRCDNGTEFKNRDMIEFCGLKGIKREYIGQKGLRGNTVMPELHNKMELLRERTGPLLRLLGPCLQINFYLTLFGLKQLVLLVMFETGISDQSLIIIQPYELLTGLLENQYDMILRLGIIYKAGLSELQFRTKELRKPAITFLENKPNVAGKGPTWLFDLDYLTDSMNYHPVRSENQANLHAGQQEANQNAGTKDIIDAGDSEKEDESAQDCFVLPIWPSYSSTITPVLTQMNKREGPREEEQVFMDELERLKRQEKEANEEAEALRKKFAQETENLVIQEGAAKPSSTNIFSTVSTPAKASSTNLVNTVSIPVSTASPNEGLSLSDPTNPEEDDSEIPPLEDIYQNSTDGIFTTSSYDDEGAVADFTNLETVVNVSPIPTSRDSSFIIHLTSRRSNLSVQKEETKIVKFRDTESLGLSRFALWEEGYRYKVGFIENKKDERGVVVRNKEVYQMDVKSAFLYGKIDEEIHGRYLSFLVEEWIQKRNIGTNSLPKSRTNMNYITRNLKKFDFANVKTASTPIETQKPLVKDEEANLCVSLHSLPSKLLVKTKFLDSDFARAILTGNPQTGSVNFLEKTISWHMPKRQTIVATSTTEAEYVAAASCCGQVLWIQNQMLDYGFNFMNTKIYIDNESTICIVKNPVYHSKTKHIAIRHHFIRDAYEKKLIQVLKIHTNDNVADLLTKAFDVSRGLIEFRESLRRVTDGTEALLIPTLFILWLDKVSTDSAKMRVAPTKDHMSTTTPFMLCPTSEVPNEPQTDSSPAQTSEVPIEQQTDLSPRPSPTTIIPDHTPERFLAKWDTSSIGLSFICELNPFQGMRVNDSPKCLYPNKGRKFAKGESSVQRNPLFNEIPEDTVDHMEIENAQDMGRTKEMVDEDKEIVRKMQIEGTDEQNEGTEEQIESTDGQRKGTEDHTEEGSFSHKPLKTPTLSICLDDDETIAKVPSQHEPLPKIDPKRQRKDEIERSEKENDELRLHLTIAPDEEKEVDYEILDRKYPIKEWKTECLGIKPQDDKAEHLEEINQNVVIRGNGQKRYFSTLMRVLSIFDREDLNDVYQLVMDRFQDEIPEGFDRVLWGDLMVMFNPDDENEFWNSQQDWNIVSWKLHGSSGVHTLVTEKGLVIHMLVEKKYPLRKEVLMQMLKLKLESEETGLTDTSTTNALVVQDGIGGYDWSFQAEEGITNFALMAYTSQGSSSSSSSDSEVIKWD
ncbi:ribonuclease H-like domain-containing protein [Tanacetum coccineum]|uniref:Ribonuclease H-like domain-containing protein n=1 Tax=Tanacetum coccineum TaxID=301880 RepID=A0ABQ4XI14_9ASTR